jgi:hypothetical protein
MTVIKREIERQIGDFGRAWLPSGIRGPSMARAKMNTTSCADGLAFQGRREFDTAADEEAVCDVAVGRARAFCLAPRRRDECRPEGRRPSAV